MRLLMDPTRQHETHLARAHIPWTKEDVSLSRAMSALPARRAGTPPRSRGLGPPPSLPTTMPQPLQRQPTQQPPPRQPPSLDGAITAPRREAPTTGPSKALGRSPSRGNAGRDLAHAVSREHNRVTTGVALTDRQMHRLLAHAQTAKARVVHTELFWVMMELVATESAGTILEMLKEAADDVDPNHRCTVCAREGPPSCSEVSHCQGCRGCVRRTRFRQPHRPGCSPGVCECSEHPPSWPHDPIAGPKYAALRPGFAASGVNLVDQQFGWNIGMHAAAQGKVGPDRHFAPPQSVTHTKLMSRRAGGDAANAAGNSRMECA